MGRVEWDSYLDSRYNGKEVSVPSLAGECVSFPKVCSESYNGVHSLEPSRVLVSLANDILTGKVR